MAIVPAEYCGQNVQPLTNRHEPSTILPNFATASSSPRDGKYRDIFRKYQKYLTFSIFLTFSIYIGYFRYFHFTALDWVMSIETLKGLCLSCMFQNGATKNNSNSNIALCNTCIAR